MSRRGAFALCLAAFTFVSLGIGRQAHAEGTGIIVITEVMYHPAGGGRDLEFIELWNATPAPIDLSGWYFSAGVDFTFPDGFFLDGRRFVVVCANEARIQEVYEIENTLGDWGVACQDAEGSMGCSLDNGGERIELSEHNGIVHTSVRYDDRGDWAAGADGFGHSLEISSPYDEQDDADSWLVSSEFGGSPGRTNRAANADASTPRIRVNEALLLTPAGEERWIELFNTLEEEVDLSSWSITNDITDLRSFVLPEDTTIGPRGFLAFSEADLGGMDLTPTANQEGGDLRTTVALVNADGSRVVDAYIFEPEVEGMSEARFPDGDDDFQDRATPTRGEPNAVPVETNVVINEIMYHPIDNDEASEWVEIHNRGDSSVDLTGWRFSRGINFDFPDGTTIAAGGYLVVAHDPVRLREIHGLDATQVIGPDPADEMAVADFGVLRDDGERINLRDGNGNLVDTVRYHDGGEWPHWCDGKGSSMELVNPWINNGAPAAWDASDDSDKAEVHQHEYVGRPSAGEPELRFFLQGRGIVRLDDIRMFQRAIAFRTDRVILDHGVEWKYFPGTQEASDPVDAWRQLDFDDAAWSSGPSPIGYGEDAVVTELTEMRQVGDEGDPDYVPGHISLFMRTKFTLDSIPDQGTLVLENTFDDGFNRLHQRRARDGADPGQHEPR